MSKVDNTIPFAYYKLDGDNNITHVTQNLPKYNPPPVEKPDRITDEQWKEFLNNYQTEEEFNEKSKEYNSILVYDYSPIWDECKRCSISLNRLPRYKFENGSIIPTDEVKNINYDSNKFILNDDGTLTWKK